MPTDRAAQQHSAPPCTATYRRVFPQPGLILYALTSPFTTIYALLQIYPDLHANASHAHFLTLFFSFVFSCGSGKILICFYNRFYMPFRMSLPRILYLQIDIQQLYKMLVVLRRSLSFLIYYSLSFLSITSFHPTTIESLALP